MSQIDAEDIVGKLLALAGEEECRSTHIFADSWTDGNFGYPESSEWRYGFFIRDINGVIYRVEAAEVKP